MGYDVVMSILEATQTALIEAAKTIQKQSYSPYSKFPVGAAVLTENGEIVTGVNVENASYGLTVCAERNAIGTMIGSGQRRITAVAVSSRNGVTPCGACRQVLIEFAHDDIPVWLIRTDTDEVTQTSLWQLIPNSFNQTLLEEGQA